MDTITYQGLNQDLVQELNQLGVRFIHAGNYTENKNQFSPDELIKLLAQNNEARLRLALIPLFLEHPEFSRFMTLSNMEEDAQTTLKFYYTAAMFFSHKLNFPSPIPDLFSKELGISLASDPDKNLQNLANRPNQLSNRNINWLGTYTYAVQIWQKGKSKKQLY